jgi:hypothetical protein
VIAVVVTLMLWNGMAKDVSNVPSVKDQVSRMSIGTSIEVRFAKAPKIRGTLSQKDEKGFTLKIEKDATATERRVAFDEVKSVKNLTHTKTPAWVWIALGAVGAVVVIAVVAFAKYRSNE